MILSAGLAWMAGIAVSCKQATFDEKYMQEAREYTERQCPQRVADGIVLDSMTYSPPLRCLNYYYTLSENLDDEKFIKSKEATFREYLTNSITNSVELKRAKSEGVSFRYVYSSKSTGRQMLSVTIRKGEYK